MIFQRSISKLFVVSTFGLMVLFSCKSTNSDSSDVEASNFPPGAVGSPMRPNQANKFPITCEPQAESHTGVFGLKFVDRSKVVVTLNDGPQTLTYKYTQGEGFYVTLRGGTKDQLGVRHWAPETILTAFGGNTLLTTTFTCSGDLLKASSSQ